MMQNPMANPIDSPSRSRGWNPSGGGFGEPFRGRPMRPAMPVFHKGTDYVEKTGPAMLEKGEAVIPKEKNMDAVKDILGGHETVKAPKKIKEMVHTKSHNGKHIVVHKHHSPHSHPDHDETHVMNDMAELHQHMEDHAGTPNEGEEAGAQTGPQLSPTPSPMAGMPGV
jgi:hypothetical protein